MKTKVSGRKNWKVFLVSLAVVLMQTGLVFAQQVRVVASWPALADITKQIGKELVSVDSLATGVEDPHGVPMKPSFVPRLNRADALVLIGPDNSAWTIRLYRLLSGDTGSRAPNAIRPGGR